MSTTPVAEESNAADSARRRPSVKARTALGSQPTPLQQHVRFFDRDGDGKIGLMETYRGCRAIGCGRLVSSTAALLINGTMAWPSARSWRPTLTIHLDGIERAMHGSDTRVYDESGAFDEARFVSMFARYDADGDGCWSLREFARRTLAQRNTFDLFGQCATVLEFGMTYYLVGEGGKLSLEALRKVYDGSLFYELAQEPMPAGWRCTPQTPPSQSQGKPVKGFEQQLN